MLVLSETHRIIIIISKKMDADNADITLSN
jgi:hypothetical protein